MKIVRFRYQDTISYGSLENRRIRRIEGSVFGDYTITNESHPLDTVVLLAPCQPSKAVCVGLNYRDHAEELKLPIPSEPVLFIKPSTSVIGPGDPIIHPRQSTRVDHEAELTIVIKKTTKDVEKADAPDYILGYTCGNDVTARDLQSPQGQWTLAKAFDTFLPLGPVITDEVDGDHLEIEARVNGVVKQHSNTANLIFKPAYLVSYISKIMTLCPGDIIMTGTPGGISPMKVGDRVEIEIQGIGILQNPIGEA
ncbi:MAG: fumarylacetoacetate hydrolase family protein [Sphaerochaetaceae bacterium]